ncbi:MAG TPA: xanthine dehydrogenase family protein subunit M [Pyrinomonadaceae bacterium]|nr:xanthine dehydrogenase family protein subunit M [Pyrinomonadaceae bacterium]
MRAHIPSYQFISSPDLSSALDKLAREPGMWRPFAGGTDLMVLLEAGKLPHKNYLNIWNLKELRGVEVTDQHVTLGALTTYTEVQQEKVLQQEFPMLCQAASETGGLAIQNRGTLGGNIVNASPAADSPPALLVYDADLEVVSANQSRWVPYHGFHTGYKEMIIRPDELLTRIRLPRRREKLRHYYRKVGTRKAQAISKVCFAGTAQVRAETIEDLRIALGSVAPVPLRCVKTEDALRGSELNQATIDQARAVMADEIVPIDDIRSTSNYRHKVSLNLLADFLQQLRA